MRVVLASSDHESRFTGFYGKPDQSMRKFTWDLLGRLGPMYDFDEVLSNDEKSVGLVVPMYRMRAFHTVMQHLGLSDLGYQGYKYTWTDRKVGPHTIRLRLDRAVGLLPESDLFQRQK